MNEWLGGALLLVFSSIVGTIWLRLNNVSKRAHESELSIAYLKGKSEGIGNEIKLIVYEALKRHEESEDKNFDEIKEHVSNISTDIAVIKKALNGQGK